MFCLRGSRVENMIQKVCLAIPHDVNYVILDME